jgi:hypothetical protein
MGLVRAGQIAEKELTPTRNVADLKRLFPRADSNAVTEEFYRAFVSPLFFCFSGLPDTDFLPRPRGPQTRLRKPRSRIRKPRPDITHGNLTREAFGEACANLVGRLGLSRLGWQRLSLSG